MRLAWWVSCGVASALWGACIMNDLLAAEPRAMTVDDLLRVARVSDPDVSPDGQQVVYVVTQADVAANTTSSTLWLAPTGAGAARQLTTTDKKDRHPRFSPDGRRVLFESNRSGTTQLWTIAVDGGEARQLTSLASEAATGVWSPDGAWVAFVSAVWPEHSALPPAEADAAHRSRQEEQDKNPVKARVVTRLFFRHWDSYVEGKRQHLFVVPAAGGIPRNLTPGDRDAYPTSTTFSVGDDFTFTPDSRHLVYTAPEARDEAWNTNHDLWRVPVEGGTPENLTADNPAADGYPRFSPDGRWIAYRAQRRAGFEADRWELTVRPATGGPARSVTGDWDRSVDQFVWDADGRGFVLLAEEAGAAGVFHVELAGGQVRRRAAGGTFASLSQNSDGRTLVALHSTLEHPPRVVVVGAAGEARSVADPNQALVAAWHTVPADSVSLPGAGGTPMQMWVLKPPGFDPARKWPVVYLVHGGPQSAWNNGWSYRWNPQVWAARGYVVLLPNPRGSTGFGQQYVDEISGDWGGKCFEDLLAGVAWVEAQPWADRTRLAAAGASFGGYMMNWFQARTDKFRTLICHCGVFNFDSEYGTTEELWFDEWDHGGPPWGNRDSYEKFSPHRFVEQFRTPMLVIHNDLDFRVPVSEGLQLFTILQRRGIPSRLVNFPDEGHWVLKPANSQFWHREVFDWLEKYAPPGPR